MGSNKRQKVREVKTEKMKGSEFFSIRVNDQWRIVFRWENNNSYDVEIIDYHK